ncbi:hypothetical protein D3C87_1484160 [compost metagenome]
MTIMEINDTTATSFGLMDENTIIRKFYFIIFIYLFFCNNFTFIIDIIIIDLSFWSYFKNTNPFNIIKTLSQYILSHSQIDNFFISKSYF